MINPNKNLPKSPPINPDAQNLLFVFSTYIYPMRATETTHMHFGCVVFTRWSLAYATPDQPVHLCATARQARTAPTSVHAGVPTIGSDADPRAMVNPNETCRKLCE